MKLDFVAPKAVGPQALTLFFMCDSYMGCDQVRCWGREGCLAEGRVGAASAGGLRVVYSQCRSGAHYPRHPPTRPPTTHRCAVGV